MQTLWQDVRYALRMLAKNPGFAAVAVLTLALGIGANTAIFSLIRQVLLQSLPVRNPEQLVLLYSPGPKRGHVYSDESGEGAPQSFSYPMYKDLRDANSVFSGLIARFGAPVSISFRGQTDRVDAEVISGNFFDALGVRPALGRTLTQEDDRVAGAHPLVVLGYGYWQRKFGGDAGLLNQSILINGQPMTVVGVVQPGFDGIQLGRVPDLYVPITMKAQITPNWNGLDDRKDYWLTLMGRLKPGVSHQQAEAALLTGYRPLLETEVKSFTDFSALTRQRFLDKRIVLRDGSRGRQVFQHQARQGLLILMGMVGLVLLIACANVAGLLIARGTGRQKEVAIRVALGASRWQLIRQLLVESCLLSFCGALLGLLVATWTSQALVSFAAESQQASGLKSTLDPPILFFALGLSILCGVLFGFAPAVRATRVELAHILKDQAGSLSAGLAHVRLRKGLVVSQVALTLLLVTASVGFARSLYRLQHLDLGLRVNRILQFAVAPELSGYDPARSIAFFDQLRERLAALPGVESASAAEVPVIADSDEGSNVSVEGESAEKAGTEHVMRNAVSPRYFSTMGIPLLAGREFTAQDSTASAKVAIVNEVFARHFFSDGNPVGRHMTFGRGGSLNIEIVGVVKDSKHSGVREEIEPFAYIPYSQKPHIGAMTFYLRTEQDPETVASAVRRGVAQLDANLPVYDLRSFEAQVSQTLSGDRLLAFLAAGFGTLAALLAAIGIYGLLAYSVAQRTREIGIRVALGASAGNVRAMIFRDLALLALLGALIGLPLAYGVGRVADSILFGVKCLDPVGVAAALSCLAVVAALAAYWPARRATRVDPMVALRYE